MQRHGIHPRHSSPALAGDLPGNLQEALPDWAFDALSQRNVVQGDPPAGGTERLTIHSGPVGLTEAASNAGESAAG